MSRLACAVALAAAVAALAALPAGAYQHLSQNVGGTGVEAERWQSLPLDLVVDNGPTDISAEIGAAVATWNAVSTARDPWGTVTKAAVDYTGANFQTAWGNLTGDGKHEVIYDEDGTGQTALGFAPGSINGFGAEHEVVVNGHAVIDDMFLIVNGTGTPAFDRRSTEIHELGHTLGLAHSTVGWAVGKDGALSPVLPSQVPTMHPFSIAGTDRQTLEADDRASLSELYPDATFTSTTGTIFGKVTRCGSGEPVLGANVRAINVASPSTQLTRVTGFDGKTDGSYEINGVPPGDYFVVVEPLAGDSVFFSRLSMFTDQVDTEFTQEYLNESQEPDCTQDADPDARESIPVGASAETPADFKVQGAGLALVIDVTGSMGPELGSIKTSLETMIDTLEDQSDHFPRTAIITFEDSATIRAVSDDPDRLRSVIAGLSTHSTPDCPEGSNAALMTAARVVAGSSKVVLVTDADSHPTGPSRAAVDALYRSKGVRLSVLLSGSCPPPPGPAKTVAAVAAPAGTGPDQARPLDVLGVEGSVRTFSEESLFSGGLFSFQPEVKTGGDAATRYANTLANLAIAAVAPAVAAVDPPATPRGTTLDVELNGSNTGFRPGSAVAVAGSGVSALSADVRSPTRIVVRLAVAADAATGFRDVTVRTDRGDGSIETATGIGAVQVTAAPSTPTILSVTPSAGAAGTTEDVTISGGLTHFAAGTSVAAFGAGVTVNHLTVVSPTSAVANVTVAPGATIGFRDATVQTGGETARRTTAFLVAAPAPPIPRLAGASPAAGRRGSTIDIVVTGTGTAFTSGKSTAAISGSGVQVLSTTVSSPASLVAHLKIAGDAPLGFRDVKVATRGETTSLLDGFEVLPAAAVESQPTPEPTVVASATPTPPAGGGGGPPSACTDRSSPRAVVSSVRARHRRLSLRGRASDTGCATLARVEVAISRAAGGRRCRFVAAGGRLLRARACSRPVWLKVTGTTRWRLALERALPRATYAIQVRAVDRAGNVQARPARRTQRVR